MIVQCKRPRMTNGAARCWRRVSDLLLLWFRRVDRYRTRVCDVDDVQKAVGFLLGLASVKAGEMVNILGQNMDLPKRINGQSIYAEMLLPMSLINY